jgi:HicA toxin of bacterial toxin-antitoxin,
VARKQSEGGQEPADPPPPRQPEWPKLSSRHRATLTAVFERPTRSDIPWRDLERLFIALGGRVEGGKGSRRRVKLGDRRAVFHEPHPEKVTDKGAVESARDFLVSAGVQP